MKKEKAKYILIVILLTSLIITNALTLKLYLNTLIVDENIILEETGDELSRVKFFILDWYDELSRIYGKPKVYHNQLQFNGKEFTITVAADRIRAVYPRGERFFQLEYVNYIEFYEQNGDIRCRLFYNETGELIFKLN